MSNSVSIKLLSLLKPNNNNSNDSNNKLNNNSINSPVNPSINLSSNLTTNNQSNNTNNNSFNDKNNKNQTTSPLSNNNTNNQSNDSLFVKDLLNKVRNKDLILNKIKNDNNVNDKRVDIQPLHSISNTPTSKIEYQIDGRVASQTESMVYGHVERIIEVDSKESKDHSVLDNQVEFKIDNKLDSKIDSQDKSKIDDSISNKVNDQKIPIVSPYFLYTKAELQYMNPYKNNPSDVQVNVKDIHRRIVDLYGPILKKKYSDRHVDTKFLERQVDRIIKDDRKKDRNVNKQVDRQTNRRLDKRNDKRIDQQTNQVKTEDKQEGSWIDSSSESTHQLTYEQQKQIFEEERKKYQSQRAASKESNEGNYSINDDPFADLSDNRIESTINPNADLDFNSLLASILNDPQTLDTSLVTEETLTTSQSSEKSRFANIFGQSNDFNNTSSFLPTYLSDKWFGEDPDASLDKQLDSQLVSQLDIQFDNQLDNQFDNQVVGLVDSQVDSIIKSSSYEKVDVLSKLGFEEPNDNNANSNNNHNNDTIESKQSIGFNSPTAVSRGSGNKNSMSVTSKLQLQKLKLKAQSLSANTATTNDKLSDQPKKQPVVTNGSPAYPHQPPSIYVPRGQPSYTNQYNQYQSNFPPFPPRPVVTSSYNHPPPVYPIAPQTIPYEVPSLDSITNVKPIKQMKKISTTFNKK